MNILIFIIIEIFKIDSNSNKTNFNLEANGRLKIKHLSKININCAVNDKTMAVQFVVINISVNPLVELKKCEKFGLISRKSINLVEKQLI